MDKTSGVRLRPPLVLVVDDYADAREAYAEFLRMAGFRVATADNGVIAIKQAHALTPDAIVLDYAMPVMDGVQAALLLKGDEATRHIPIVMLTAFRDRVECQAVCDAYFEKPCDPDSLANAVRSLVETTTTTTAASPCPSDSIDD